MAASAIEESDVATWQLILLGLFVVIPLLLLSGFHPDRERLSSRGKPLGREWTSQGSREIEEHEPH